MDSGFWGRTVLSLPSMPRWPFCDANAQLGLHSIPSIESHSQAWWLLGSSPCERLEGFCPAQEQSKCRPLKASDDLARSSSFRGSIAIYYAQDFVVSRLAPVPVEICATSLSSETSTARCRAFESMQEERSTPATSTIHALINRSPQEATLDAAVKVMLACTMEYVPTNQHTPAAVASTRKVARMHTTKTLLAISSAVSDSNPLRTLVLTHNLNSRLIRVRRCVQRHQPSLGMLYSIRHRRG